LVANVSVSLAQLSPERSDGANKGLGTLQHGVL
jgi:hypothetical protein